MPDPQSAADPQNGRGLQRFVWQIAVLVFLWWMLTAGAVEPWLVGIPTVLAASMLSWSLRSARGWNFSLLGLVAFVPEFLRFSLQGAIDVAWRSLHPRLPIEPRMMNYELRLSTPAARTFFMNVVSLLPGSVAVDVRDRTLLVHVLDRRLPVTRQLQKLELLIAGMFQDRGATPDRQS
jgi:multicomponent Na+:H+ antiporter subunit E